MHISSRFSLVLVGFIAFSRLFSQHDNRSAAPADTSIQTNTSHQEPHTQAQQADNQGHTDAHAEAHHDEKFDPKAVAFHHISDLNVYSIGPWNFPLPCILYAPDQGWSTFSSAKFGIDNGHHGSGHYAIDRYVLDHGMVKRVTDPSFPMGKVEITGFESKKETIKGKEKDRGYVIANGQSYPLDLQSTADAGIFGGGITSFYDFSITKNVFTMLLVIGLISIAFLTVARAYKKRDGMAPKGFQGFMETFVVFIRDEVAKPFIGAKHERYLPLLLSMFFFILSLNLFGQIPFLGGSNVTGNLGVTMVLALIAFFVTNLSGNKHYWEHIFWMPGVPAWVKTILTPVEIMGVFIKPFTLMLRLFANITAGHVVMVVFVGLIFIFGKSGQNVPASYGAAIPSVLLTLFMMAIELLVAFIQAFVFTLLTASYIGAATEEHVHHADDKGHH